MLKLSTEFVVAFLEGTRNTLKIQCGIDATPEKPFLKGTHPEPQVALTGIIGMMSDQFNGNIHLSFTESAFLAIMGKMLGEEFKTITDELSSGASEMLNIIYGSAKTVLNKQGYNIRTAIPTVIRGHDLRIKTVSPSPTLILPFKTPFGDFFLEITEQQNWIDPATQPKV
jgi:chemotaxis protein CheX